MLLATRGQLLMAGPGGLLHVRPRALRVSKREFATFKKLLLALGQLTDVQTRLRPDAAASDPASPREREARLRAFMAWMHANKALVAPADGARGRGEWISVERLAELERRDEQLAAVEQNAWLRGEDL